MKLKFWRKKKKKKHFKKKLKEACRNVLQSSEIWLELAGKERRLRRMKQSFGVEYMDQIMQQQQQQHRDYDGNIDIRLQQCYRSFRDMITGLAYEIEQFRQQISPQEMPSTPSSSRHCHDCDYDTKTQYQPPPLTTKYDDDRSNYYNGKSEYDHSRLSGPPTEWKKDSWSRRIQLQMKRRQLHRTKQSFGIDYMNIILQQQHQRDDGNHNHIVMSPQQCIEMYQHRIRCLDDDIQRLLLYETSESNMMQHPQQERSNSYDNTHRNRKPSVVDEDIAHLSYEFEQNMNIPPKHHHHSSSRGSKGNGSPMMDHHCHHDSSYHSSLSSSSSSSRNPPRRPPPPPSQQQQQHFPSSFLSPSAPPPPRSQHSESNKSHHSQEQNPFSFLSPTAPPPPRSQHSETNKSHHTQEQHPSSFVAPTAPPPPKSQHSEANISHHHHHNVSTPSGVRYTHEVVKYPPIDFWESNDRDIFVPNAEVLLHVSTPSGVRDTHEVAKYPPIDFWESNDRDVFVPNKEVLLHRPYPPTAPPPPPPPALTPSPNNNNNNNNIHYHPEMTAVVLPNGRTVHVSAPTEEVTVQ